MTGNELCPECSSSLELVNEYSQESHYNCPGCGYYIIVSEAENHPIAEHIYLQLKTESEIEIKLLKEIIVNAMKHRSPIIEEGDFCDQIQNTQTETEGDSPND